MDPNSISPSVLSSVQPASSRASEPGLLPMLGTERNETVWWRDGQLHPEKWMGGDQGSRKEKEADLETVSQAKQERSCQDRPYSFCPLHPVLFCQHRTQDSAATQHSSPQKRVRQVTVAAEHGFHSRGDKATSCSSLFFFNGQEQAMIPP